MRCLPNGCVTSGAWSGELLAHLGVRPALRPIRGQIVLLACVAPPFERIVNHGRRYLVPRDDGRLLVGSTEEDAGFQKQTTAEGVAGLLQFALDLAPTLVGTRSSGPGRACGRPRPIERPYLGRVPGFDNAFVAAGHFRKGLQLSSATAVVLGQVIRGQQPLISLETFRVDR